MPALMMEMATVQELFSAAAEKFGDDGVKEAFAPAPMLTFMAKSGPNPGALAKDGEVEIDGDTAKISLKKELEKGMSRTTSMKLQKIDGLWYMEGPPADNEMAQKSMAAAKEMFSTFVPAFEKAVNESADKDAFVAAMAEPAQAAMAAMMAARPQ